MLAASLVTVALGRDLVLHQLQNIITTTSGPPPGSVSVFKKSDATALLHHVDCWVDGSALCTSITLFYRSQPRHRPPALTVLSIAPSIDLLSVCPGLIFFVVFSFFYVLTVVLLKDMGESFLLSEYEPLTPNIDGVMALWIFRRRAQTRKSAENR